MDLRPGGKVFGTSKRDSYEVLQLVGSGAFGIVYKIKNSRGELFALKTITTGWLDTTELKSLLNEGKLATGIEHDNVLNVLFFHDGLQYPELPPYMIMEYASGGTLADVLGERRRSHKQFSKDEMYSVFLQLAQGMKAINEKLVHRDIKPDNILLKDNILKISDFGLSKIVGAATRSESFKEIHQIRYAAPEAWLLEKNTSSMDMYSMGIVFYELATLKHPYEVAEIGNVVEAWKRVHLSQMPGDPQTHNPDVDASLSQLIMKMIAKRVEDRYESWDGVIARLQRPTEEAKEHRDVQLLVERADQSWTDAERARLKAEEEAQKRSDREQLVGHAFSEILRAARETVDEFNKRSEHLRLHIKQVLPLSFSIELETPPRQGVEVKVQTVHEGHKLANQEIRAWGVVKAPSGRGFNLVLTLDGEEDLYGTWHTLHVEHSALVEATDDRPEPFPFELDELPREIRLVNALHVYQTRKRRFEGKLLDPLITELF